MLTNKIYRYISCGKIILFAIAGSIAVSSCKKLVEIDPPISSITADELFARDDQADAAMAGAYTYMINGLSLTSNGALSNFASGLTSVVAGYSADELVLNSGSTGFQTNKLTPSNAFYSSTIWATAYKTIYNVDGVIEGIAASHSPLLHDSVRQELTAEAKFVRAFCYSYLVNFYGGVPKVLTIDFNQVVNNPRASKEEIFDQIIQDLKDAQSILPDSYMYGNNERVIPNKWAATALLARVYLAKGDYANAALLSSSIINKTATYSLVTDPNGVFLKNSKEAIWQLQQDKNIKNPGNATPEGTQFIPVPQKNTGRLQQFITTQLLGSFEPGDKRRKLWIDSTTNAATVFTNWFYFPAKYKTGGNNFVAGATPTEYYMVLRLAEQYLIRAEAEAKGATGGSAAAVIDLNTIRARAGLSALPDTLTGDALWLAISHERQTELFCEWGHRWFDLIRMGLASATLSQIPGKQPWAGDYQLLYPIPLTEISADHNLQQNPGYF